MTTTTSANEAGTDAELIQLDDDNDLSYLTPEFVGAVHDHALRLIKAEAEDDAEADAKLAGTSHVRGTISAQIDDDLDSHGSNGLLDAIMQRQKLKREAAAELVEDPAREQAADEASGAGASGAAGAAAEEATVAKAVDEVVSTDQANVAEEAEVVEEDQGVDNVEDVDDNKTVDDLKVVDETKAVDKTKATDEAKVVRVDEPSMEEASATPADNGPVTQTAVDEPATTAEVNTTEGAVDNEAAATPDNDAENSTSASPASAHIPITPVTPSAGLDRDDLEVGDADELPESGENVPITEEQDKRSLLEVDLEGKDGGEASGTGTEGHSVVAALATTAAVATAVAVPAVAASGATTTEVAPEAPKTKETAPIVTDSPPCAIDTPTALATEASLIVPQNTPAVTDAPNTFIAAPVAVNIADLNKNVLVNTSPALQRVEEMGNLVQERQTATPPPAYEEQAGTAIAEEEEDDHLTIRPARDAASSPTAQTMMSIPSIRSVPSLRSLRSLRSETAPEEHELFEAGEADEDTATGALANYGTVAPDHGSPAAVAWAAATRERQRRKMKTREYHSGIPLTLAQSSWSPSPSPGSSTTSARVFATPRSRLRPSK